MKRNIITTAALCLLFLLSACAPAKQQQESVTNPAQAPESGVIDTNALFMDYLNKNQDIIKTNILVTCKTAYPELVIEDAIPGKAIIYVVDQNPTTVSYKPVIQINLDDYYYVDIGSGVLVTRNSDKVVITDENIMNLVNKEALKLSNGKSSFASDVVLEAINGTVYVKATTCTLE